MSYKTAHESRRRKTALRMFWDKNGERLTTVACLLVIVLLFHLAT